MIEPENPLHRLEERSREKRKIEEENRSRALSAAAVSLTAHGFNQFTYELELRTVNLANESDPILKPLLGFFNQYINVARERIRIDLEDLRSVERAIFETCKPRIQARQHIGMHNPVSAAQWETDLLGKPLDVPLELLATDYLPNFVEFQPSSSMLLERNS